MEIEIQNKKNNPLLNRMEVQFVIRHEGESTPKRALIKNELAEQLKANKENVIIDHMRSNFGFEETIGYAKVYSSVAKAKDGESTHILKRNNVAGVGKKKEDKPKEETDTSSAPQAPKKEGEEKPADTTEEPSAEQPEDKPEDASTEGSVGATPSEVPEKKEETAEPKDTPPEDKKEEKE